MIFSSWSNNGYAVGVAVSDNGKIGGSWRQQEELLYPGNGGHRMFFKDLDGEIVFTLFSFFVGGKSIPVLYVLTFIASMFSTMTNAYRPMTVVVSACWRNTAENQFCKKDSIDIKYKYVIL